MKDSKYLIEIPGVPSSIWTHSHSSRVCGVPARVDERGLVRFFSDRGLAATFIKRGEWPPDSMGSQFWIHNKTWVSLHSKHHSVCETRALILLFC